MNRYIAQGLLVDALAGRRVIVVGSAVELGEAFYMLQDAGGDRVVKAVLANGRQRLDFENGGRISFVRRGRGIRPTRYLQGMSADVVFLLDREDGNDPDLVCDAAMAVHCSPVGEVIRA